MSEHSAPLQPEVVPSVQTEFTNLYALENC